MKILLTKGMLDVILIKTSTEAKQSTLKSKQ